MQLLIDLVLITILVLICLRAVKKGFVLSALEFAFSFLGTVLSWVVAAAFCGQVYERALKAHVLTYLNDSLLPNISASVQDNVQSVLQAIPASVMDFARQLGLVGDLGEINFSGVITAEQLEQSFLGPIALFFVKCLMFAILAVILGIVLRFVAAAVNRIVKHSPLKSLNALLGGVFGLLRGALVVLVLAMILVFSAYLIPESPLAQYIAASKICTLAVEILNLI